MCDISVDDQACSSTGLQPLYYDGLSFGTHSFRIGYINRYAETFRNVGDVQSRVRHKNLRSTMKYIRGRGNDELTELANQAGM